MINSGQYHPRPDRQIVQTPVVGLAYGLGVIGANLGVVIEVETSSIPVAKGTGRLVTTGLVEEEEIGGSRMRLRPGARHDSAQNLRLFSAGVL